MTVDEPGKAETATSETGSSTSAPRTAGAGAAAGPDSPIAQKSARPGGHRAQVAEATRSGKSTGGPLGSGWAPPEASRSRRLLTTALTALGIAIGAAVVLGLLVAYLTRGVGETSTKATPGVPSLTIPDGSAPSAASGDGVPAEWVEQTTRSGLVFRAPPGWTQRTDAVVDYRIDPAGPEQVGVGLSTAGDADSAVTNYAQNTYRGQTAFVAQPAVDATAARGERARQLTLTYTRQGTPVSVVVRALPTARGVVVISTRSAADNPQRAVQLADSTDASLRRP